MIVTLMEHGAELMVYGAKLELMDLGPLIEERLRVERAWVKAGEPATGDPYWRQQIATDVVASRVEELEGR